MSKPERCPKCLMSKPEPRFFGCSHSWHDAVQSKPEPVLPEGMEHALQLFGRVTADHTHACLIGPPCQAVVELRRAIAAAIKRAEANGLEHRRSFGGDLFHERAAKLRAEADALEKEPADG